MHPPRRQVWAGKDRGVTGGELQIDVKSGKVAGSKGQRGDGVEGTPGPWPCRAAGREQEASAPLLLLAAPHWLNPLKAKGNGTQKQKMKNHRNRRKGSLGDDTERLAEGFPACHPWKALLPFPSKNVSHVLTL